jgi:hypothetical protein
MYTPDISASTIHVCGDNKPPLTLWERENGLSFGNLLSTMTCLYTREFKPLFSEQDCSCIKCYDNSTWSFIIQHASKLNKKTLWNDIIKRWEPTEFDQDLSENSDTNSEYEFRTYKSVYGIPVDSYNSACDSCAPMTESPRGIGFIKAFYGVDTSDTSEGCCACNAVSPTLVVQRLVDADTDEWETVSDNASTSYVFDKNNNKDYRLLFRMDDNYVNGFIPCGDHVWRVYQTDYVEKADGLYVLSNLLPSYGNSSGTITIKFIDVLDNTQTFECNYQWSFSVQ